MHKGQRKIFFHSSCCYLHVSEGYYYNSFLFFCRLNNLNSFSCYLWDVILVLWPQSVPSSGLYPPCLSGVQHPGFTHTKQKEHVLSLTGDIPVQLPSSKLRNWKAERRNGNLLHCDQGRYFKTKHFIGSLCNKTIFNLKFIYFHEHLFEYSQKVNATEDTKATLTNSDKYS